MIRALRRFGKDERGAAAFLMVCGMVPLVLLVFFMVNTAKSINDKNRTQDAADAIALVHATETARALNTISMNQVTLTQTFAVAVNTSSLNNALVINGAMILFNAAEIIRYAKRCDDLAKAAAAASVILAPIADAIGKAAGLACTITMIPEGTQLAGQGIRTFRIGNTYSPRDTFDVAKRALLAANAMNKETIDRFPGTIQSAVSPIGRSAKVTDFYFDESCVRGLASSCDSGNKRQGMELPIERGDSIASAANAHFCGALYFGTGGIAGQGLLNGSYIKRGFPSNRGPARSGNSPNIALDKHVNSRTGIGRLLQDTDNTARSIRWKSSWAGRFGQPYPRRQTQTSNLFFDFVTAQTGIKCSGVGNVLPVDDILGAFSMITFGLILTVPKFDVYHTVDVGLVPKILPSIDSFSEAYKPLAFVFRKPNARWAPELFKPPKPGFYAYAQAIAYNPDEIGLYSQNWAARLIAAKKMDNLSPILNRMSSKASSSFDNLRERMAKVTDMTGWREINAH